MRTSTEWDELARAWAAELGSDHPAVAVALNNSAVARHNLEGADPRLDVPVFRQTLLLLERAYGPDEPQVAVVGNNLACALLGDVELEAVAPAEDLEQISTRGDTLHPEAVASLSEPPYGTQAPQNPRWARSLFERAVDVLERAYGANDVRLATPLNNLGLCYAASPDGLEQACAVHERALAIERRSYGAGSVATTRSLLLLSDVLGRLGRAAQADALLEQAHRIERVAEEPGGPALPRPALRRTTLLLVDATTARSHRPPTPPASGLTWAALAPPPPPAEFRRRPPLPPPSFADRLWEFWRGDGTADRWAFGLARSTGTTLSWAAALGYAAFVWWVTRSAQTDPTINPIRNLIFIPGAAVIGFRWAHSAYPVLHLHPRGLTVRGGWDGHQRWIDTTIAWRDVTAVSLGSNGLLISAPGAPQLVNGTIHVEPAGKPLLTDNPSLEEARDRIVAMAHAHPGSVAGSTRPSISLIAAVYWTALTITAQILGAAG